MKIQSCKNISQVLSTQLCVCLFFISTFLLVFWLIRSDSKTSFIRLPPFRGQIRSITHNSYTDWKPRELLNKKKIHKRYIFKWSSLDTKTQFWSHGWKPQFPFTSSLLNPHSNHFPCQTLTLKSHYVHTPTASLTSTWHSGARYQATEDSPSPLEPVKLFKVTNP